jgi:hypothetical protein
MEIDKHTREQRQAPSDVRPFSPRRATPAATSERRSDRVLKGRETADNDDPGPSAA